MSDDPSTWIHCPDQAKRERIAREIREFRESLWQPKKPKGMPYQKVMRVRESLNFTDYPVIRWQSVADSDIPEPRHKDRQQP